jgi:hypothetical protein
VFYTAFLLLTLGGDATEAQPVQPAAKEPPAVYLAYYWRARPGKLTEYGDYIRRIAEPIDEEARRSGVFEQVWTFTPALVTGAAGSDWTHLRVFKLKNFASWDTFSAGLDAAAARLYPDPDERRRTLSASGELRDLVRQEIWREFR